MRIKRVLQGTALTALAAAAWMGAGSTDASAEVKGVSIGTATDSSYVLSVTAESDDPEVMVGVAKVSKDGKAKVSAWDVYEGSSAEVDLSKLNVANDNFFAVKTDDMAKPMFVGIAASSKKNKIEFNAGSAKITKLQTTVGKTTAEYTSDIEVRTATGKWASVQQTTEFSKYQYQGATLYVRIPADGTKKTEKLEITDVTIDKKNTAKETVKQLGSLPSKETKLNIAKQANGPKVAVDYVKGLVTLPAKTEYRVVAAVADVVSPTAVGDVKVATTPGALLKGKDKAVLEVRKAASIEKKGKAASKWTRVELVKPQAAGFSTTGEVSTSGALTATATTGGAVKIQFTSNTKGDAVALSFETTGNFDYYIGEPTYDGKGFKAVKKKKVVIKKALVDGKDIYVRSCGDKATQTWAGEWEKITTVNFPK